MDREPGRAHLPSLAQQTPMPISSAMVIVLGSAMWLIALVVMMAVPSLHTGARAWWPWTAVTGLVLGGLGYAYLRRGRGNASDA